ncbi:hypothetical protein F2P56_030588, partial [Juglans regia]
MVSTAFSFDCSITDKEGLACRPMSQVTPESHASPNNVIEFVLLLGQKNVKGQINVGFLIFAVDIKYFVAEIVDKFHVVLSLTRHPRGAAQAEGKDKDQCKAIKLSHPHALHFHVYICAEFEDVRTSMAEICSHRSFVNAFAAKECLAHVQKL